MNNETRTPAANVVTLLRLRAAENPVTAAFRWSHGGADRSITFAELWDRIDRCSVGLRAAGLSSGDRAIVMIPMSVELYTVLLAILKIGAVAVFVDPWLSIRTIAAFAAFSNPTAFFGTPKSHILRFADKRLWSIPLCVSTRSFVGFPARAINDLLLRSGDNEVFEAPTDAPALITFTSGSSGMPKGANRTHRFLMAQHRALRAVIPYGQADVDLSMFPVFALNNLATGITTVIPFMDFKNVARVDGSSIARQMESAEVTTCTVSPPLLDALADSPGGTRLKLRRIVTGGAPITDRQLVRWKEAFGTAEIVIAYGSTEAEPVAHCSAEDRLALPRPRRGYCMGSPIEQICARLIPITKGPVRLGPDGWKGIELTPGEIGELVVQGEHVCGEYYNNVSATEENKIIDPGGTVWHRMGDTGYLDTAGRFWLVGRVHSSIVRGDTVIHPQLLEQAVLEQISEAGMVAVLEVEERVMFVTARRISEDSIAAALETSGFSVDGIITGFGNFPMDPRHNSKVDYERLRKILKARRFG